jgi:hypothetical protein
MSSDSKNELFNGSDVIVSYQDRGAVGNVMCYAYYRNMLQTVQEVLKNGLKHELQYELQLYNSEAEEARKGCIWLSADTPSTYSDVYEFGVEIRSDAKVGHAGFRRSGKEQMYSDSRMTLSEYKTLLKERPTDNIISCDKEYTLGSNYYYDFQSHKKEYIPECVINTECIELDKISYLSGACIRLLKQMYKEGEVDSSNLLVQRFCPELIADLNQNDARNASNDGYRGKETDDAQHASNDKQGSQLVSSNNPSNDRHEGEETNSSNLLVPSLPPEYLNQNDARNASNDGYRGKETDDAQHASNDKQGSRFSFIKNLFSSLLPFKSRSRIYEEPYKPEEIDDVIPPRKSSTPSTENLRTGF